MKKYQKSNHTRKAFTMTEVLMALSLLIIFFAVAGELFKSTMLLSFNAPRQSDRATQTDSALFQLRRDAWNATQIAVPENKSANIESSDEKISWKIQPNGDLTRTDNRNQSEQWKAIGQHWSLTADSNSLTIKDGAAETRLPSQILLVRGTHP